MELLQLTLYTNASDIWFKMIFNRNEKNLKVARSFLENGKFIDGLNFLKKKRIYFFFLNRSSVNKTVFLFIYGAFLANLGNYKKSLAYLKKSLTGSYPEKSEILYYIIISYLNLNDRDKTLFYFNKLTERSFNTFYIFLSYYKCKRSGMDLKIQHDSFEDFLPETKNNMTDLLTYSIFCLIKDDLENAEKYILEISDQNKDINYFYNIINLTILFRSRKFDEIILYYQPRSENLVSIDALFIYSASLYKLKLFDESLKVINQILFLKPNHILSHINKAKIYYNKNKITECINILKYTLKQKNRYQDEILFLLTAASGHHGLLNDILKYFSRMNQSSIYYLKTAFNLSLIYFDLQMIRESKITFRLIDNNILQNENYPKWKKNIMSLSTKNTKVENIHLMIKLVPVFVLITALAVFLILYFFVKS